MPRYSEERKQAVLSKLLPPLNMTVAEVSRVEGIGQQTLYNWRDKAILAKRKQRLEKAKAANPNHWGKRNVRNCEPVGSTTLNPEKPSVKQEEKQVV